MSSQEVCFLFVFSGRSSWLERQVGTRVFLSPQWMWLLRDRQVGQRTALVGLSVEKWVICVQIVIGIGKKLRACLDANFFGFGYRSIFVCI